MFPEDNYNQAIETASKNASMVLKRTYRERIQDKIAYHKSEIANLESLLNTLTPEVEKFIDASQKVHV